MFFFLKKADAPKLWELNWGMSQLTSLHYNLTFMWYTIFFSLGVRKEAQGNKRKQSILLDKWKHSADLNLSSIVCPVI